MSVDCIFCKIVRGEIPAHKVYEDALSLAFLDIHPMADGHTIVIPKAHHERIENVPVQEIGKIFEATQKVTEAVQKALNAPASNIGINNGRAAGQAILHMHIHIVPRYPGDGGGSLHSLLQGPIKSGFDEVRKRIAAAMGT